MNFGTRTYDDKISARRHARLVLGRDAREGEHYTIETLIGLRGRPVYRWRSELDSRGDPLALWRKTA